MKQQYTFLRLFSFLPFLLAAFLWLGGSSVYAGGVSSGNGDCELNAWAQSGNSSSCACTWIEETSPGNWELVCSWASCAQAYLEECIWDCNSDHGGAFPLDPTVQFRDCSEIAANTPPGDTPIYCWYNGVGNGAGEVTCNNIAIIILPVELTYFNGFYDGKDNVLEWTTASEFENDHFKILHSFDGINFTDEMIVDGMGTTSSETNYRFVHTNIQNRVNYYKIRQVDYNGEYEESDVIAIDNRNVNSADLFVGPYPNPADQSFNFNYNGSDYTQPIQLSLIDQQGKKIIDNLFIIPGTSWQGIPIRTADFESGIYFLELVQGDYKEMKRVSIIH